MVRIIGDSTAGQNRGRGGEGGTKGWALLRYEKLDGTVWDHILSAYDPGKQIKLNESNFYSYARIRIQGAQKSVINHLASGVLKKYRFMSFVKAPVDGMNRLRSVMD